MKFKEFTNNQKIETVEVKSTFTDLELAVMEGGHSIDNTTTRKSAISQAIEEATSLATMRDYFAGQDDARDPYEITKQRRWFDANKDKLPANVKKKAFNSRWEYEQWLQKNKLKPLTKEEQEVDEAPMNPGEFAKAISAGGEQGVLVGFEFEVCIPEATVSMGAEAEKAPTGRTIEDIANILYDHSVFDDTNFESLSPANFDEVFKLKTAVKGYNNMQEAQEDYAKSLLPKVQKEFYDIPEDARKQYLKLYKSKFGAPSNDSVESQLEFAKTFGHLIYAESKSGSKLEGQGQRLRYTARRATNWGDFFGYLFGFTSEQIGSRFNRYFSYDPDQGYDALGLDNYDDGYDDDYDYDEDEDYSKASTVLSAAVQAAMGAKVNVFNSYHERSKNLTDWYIEPDGSLESDNDGDATAEIVSPPLPAVKAIEDLQKFYAMASQLKLYTNGSTGLHINVSIPLKLDVLKLAMFLGDQHVLQYFNRQDNGYAKSVLNSLTRSARNSALSGDDLTTTKIAKKQSTVFNQPAQTISIDMKALQQIVKDHSGAHTASISNNGKYISFRHAGGNYLSDYNGIYNTVGRFIRAMIIASDPNAYVNEYKTKLAKLVTDKPELAKNSPASSITSYIRSKGLPVIKLYTVVVTKNNKTPQQLVQQHYGRKFTIGKVETNSEQARTVLSGRFKSPAKAEQIQKMPVEKFCTITLLPKLESLQSILSYRTSGVNTIEGNSWNTWAYYTEDLTNLPVADPVTQQFLKQILRTHYTKKESVSALGQAVNAVEEGMRSVREGEPGIKRVTRKRIDDSTEVRYHVVDSNGVTHKSFDDLNNAKRWLSANRDILSKD